MSELKNKTYNPQKRAEEERSSTNFKNIVRSALGQGLALGFGDEVEAFAKSLASNKDYDDIAKEVRQEIDQFRTDNPALAYSTEIGGALIPSLAVGAVTGGTGTAANITATGARVAGAGRRINQAKNIAKQTAPQVGLGAAYGAGVSEGDAIDRAKSAVASGGITAVASPVGSAVLPKVSEAAKRLMNKGTQLTPGQATQGTVVGDTLKRLEETVSSLPLIGTEKALQRSTQTFNRSVINDALKKINKQLPSVVDDAGLYLDRQVRNALDRSVKNLKVNDINQLRSKIDNALSNSLLKPNEIKDINIRLNKLFYGKAKDNRLTGESLQKADSWLRSQIRRYRTSGDAVQREMGDVYDDVYKVLDDALQSDNPKDLITAYNSAKSAYGDLLVISKAGTASANQGNIFTPAQLRQAGKAADKSSGKTKTFRGESKMQDIAELGQNMIGQTLSDSGTSARTLTAGGLLGGGAMVDPLSAGIAGTILSGYQNPATQKLLLELLRGSGQVGRTSIPVVSGRVGRDVTQN
tara:strand:- start:19196 stop:20767 length:1572 start_codon:yes stop_codon:yes gene_type:complete